ncbi:E3 ubiquitin-protein ligase RBBP6, partial [Ophiophagus hannah]
MLILHPFRRTRSSDNQLALPIPPCPSQESPQGPSGSQISHCPAPHFGLQGAPGRLSRPKMGHGVIQLPLPLFWLPGGSREAFKGKRKEGRKEEKERKK